MYNSPEWISTALIYHIYPLGLTSAPFYNQYDQPSENRLEQLYPWLDHLQWLGINTIFLGPILQSRSHGYDVVDYFHIDRRLGDNHTFKFFSEAVHQRGMRIVLDAVFNHSSRDFFAFQDLLKNEQNSGYKDWYDGVQFGQSSPAGDSFTYYTWDGYTDLPKFNLSNPDVVEHLFQAVRYWMEEWQIDGLRLDAADNLRLDFLKRLRKMTSARREDFWLMGEVVHGQYQQWANPQQLHSTTNYEAYKGLYSSFNDGNFFEIAHSLERQFGAGGLYRDLQLYNFVDNHDVNRIIDQIKNKKHLYLVYALLFCMPGIPSIYYGSEWGLHGVRSAHSDHALRPAIHLHQMINQAPEKDLPQFIQNLAKFRAENPALQRGSYYPAFIQSRQFGFWREFENNKVLVLINAGTEPFPTNPINIPEITKKVTVFDRRTNFEIIESSIHAEIPPEWLAIFTFNC